MKKLLSILRFTAQLEFFLKSLGEETLGISSRVYLFFCNVVAKGQTGMWHFKNNFLYPQFKTPYSGFKSMIQNRGGNNVLFWV